MAKDGCIETASNMPMFSVTTSSGAFAFPWHHVLLVELLQHMDQMFRTIEIRTSYAKITINGNSLEKLHKHFQDQDLYALARGPSSHFQVDNINVEVTLE